MSSSATPYDEAAARAERKAARRAKRAARKAGEVEDEPEQVPQQVAEPSEPVKKSRKTRVEANIEEQVTSEGEKTTQSEVDGGATSPSKSSRRKRPSKRPARSGDDEVDEEIATRTAADEEFIRQVRTSLDMNRDFYPHDARKSLEKPPRAADYRPSVELRRSFEKPSRRSSIAGRGGDATTTSHSSFERPRAGSTQIEPEMEKTQDEDEFLRTFPISEGLSTQQAQDLLAQYGRNELPEKVKPKWLIFLSLLWQPMPIMIWIAAIIEVAIGSYIDFAVLIAINLINATLGFYETTKAGDAVAALKASLKPTACCFRDGAWDNNFDASLLVPGDLVELGSGRAVPADCMINEGQIEVDESAMTGESLPVTIREREMAKMGGTVVSGETHATVVFTGKSTFFGKTASMLGGSEGYSNLQKLLLKVIVILCVLAFLLVLACFIYLVVKFKNAKEAISFAVIVLVASIPMAVEIVTTSTLAIGSRAMSKYGAIVSRLAAIEDLAGLNMLCSDKTGTLTKNKMTIQPEAPTFVDGLDQMDLLRQAALAATWTSPPKDALDTLFLRCHLWCPGIKEMVEEAAKDHPDWTPADRDAYYNDKINEKLQENLADYESLAYMPFDPRVKRTESTVRQKSTGRIFKVTKGAPHILRQLDQDEKKNEKVSEKVEEYGADGIRAVAIAVSDDLTDVWDVNAKEQDPNMVITWHITGLLTFLDPPRDDTKDTIARSQAYGVPVRMITGDHLLIARKTARDLDMGIKSHPNWPNIEGPDQLPTLDEDGKAPHDLVERYGDYIRDADGFAQVFPEHKFLIVETYRRLGFKCGMTGDGVNDAPALKRADVGIAVAGATDAARAAADIVLTEEGLSTIVIGLEIARVIFARMKSFLTYRIAATLQLLFFFFIAVFAFEPLEYVKHGIAAPPPPVNTTAPDFFDPSAPFAPIEPVPLAPVTPPPPSIPNAKEWPEFFSLPVIYLIIITVINDGTLISIGYDHAVPSRYPERWVLPVLFMVSATLAAVACFSSLLWLYWCLDSWRPDSVFQKWGIGGIRHYGHIVNMIFLKVAVSDILTLFASRTSHQFFFMRMPHFILSIACIIALGVTTTLSLTWPCTTLDKRPVCGLAYKDGKLLALWVWIYCVIVFIIQDVLKVGMWWLVRYFNLFNNNNEIDSSVLGSDSTHDAEMETMKADAKDAEEVATETPLIVEKVPKANGHAQTNGNSTKRKRSKRRNASADSTPKQRRRRRRNAKAEEDDSDAPKPKAARKARRKPVKEDSSEAEESSSEEVKQPEPELSTSSDDSSSSSEEEVEDDNSSTSSDSE